MSVSLKKPEKVDLSKSELPRKLPEYTPIHLIDEEETIVNRPPRVSHSDVHLRVEKSQSDGMVSDSTSKEVNENQPHSLKRIFIGIVLAAAVILAVSLIFLNLPNDFFQELSKASEDSQDFLTFSYKIFSYMVSNPIIIAILVISFAVAGINLIRKVFGTFTRW
ncbi:MAG: hypothetical protein K2N06_03545 [Oscillospiraceae bacterium]|nr:hypothetical protein [Oscillospiraceae bacterium]